jgi:hypothetical protein
MPAVTDGSIKALEIEDLESRTNSSKGTMPVPNRTRRIKALEEKAAKRFADENCICHPSGVAQFHTDEECNEARKISVRFTEFPGSREPSLYFRLKFR